MPRQPIPKEPLDRVIDLCRKYYGIASSPCDVEDTISLCLRIEDATGISWFCLQNLVCSMFPRWGGLKPDISNEEIYTILRLLGWEVSD